MPQARSRMTYDDVLRAEAGTAVRACEHGGCGGEGLYRAPRSPQQLREYRWFCLDHVRAYNKAWDFCKGMGEAEIEAMVRRDTIGDRPTWPAAASGASKFHMYSRLKRAAFAGAGFFGLDDDPDERQEHEAFGRHRNAAAPLSAMEKALAVLELQPPVEFAQVKRRYRTLVKRDHPDLNQGDPKAEERFKQLNEAFQVLKKAYNA